MPNEFRSLIDYYDAQRESFVPFQFQKKETEKQKIIEVEKKKKKKVGFEVITNDLEVKELPDSLDKKQKISQNDGFDLDAFNKIMQAELISNYQKHQSFSHPNISFGECVSCIRQQYYKRKKYPLNLEKLFSFSCLFLIHEVDDFLLSLIQKTYKFEETNKYITGKQYSVRGNIHAVDKSSGYLYVLNPVDPLNFKNNYISSHANIGQIQAHILNMDYDYDISKIVLVYILRNMKSIYKYTLDRDSKIAEQYLNNGMELKKCLDNNKVPEPLGKTDSQCAFCMFKKFCKADSKNNDSDIIVLL